MYVQPKRPKYLVIVCENHALLVDNLDKNLHSYTKNRRHC